MKKYFTFGVFILIIFSSFSNIINAYSLNGNFIKSSFSFQNNLCKAEGLSNITNWLCVYSDVSVKEIVDTNFDLVVIDPDEFELEDITDIKNSGKIVIAYLSIGEAENYRFYWDPDALYLLEENPEWEGCYYVDYSNKEWQQIILDEYIPQIKNKGFDGLYLDTLETYNLEDDYPNCSKENMIKFVINISSSSITQELFIICQNGLEIIMNLIDYIDAVGVEETYYKAVYLIFLYLYINGIPQRNYITRGNENIMRDLLDIKKNVLTLDYSIFPYQIRRCYEKSRSNGFIPYVSTAELNRIFEI